MNFSGYPNQNQMFNQAPMDQLTQLRQMYQQQMPQMIQMPQIPQAQQIPMAPQGSILWVKSRQVIENMQIPPNSAISAWDENRPFVYIVKTDATGKATITDLRVSEETGAPQPKFATLEDLQALEARIMNSGYTPKFLKEDAANE